MLDTNILLHSVPLPQIGWTEVVGQEAVSLVVPLRVIEELNAKKYARRPDLASRARRLLPQLESMLGSIHWPNGADVAPETLHFWVARGRDNVSG